MPAIKAVHRPLHLTSPLADGPDVRSLQGAIKKGLARHKIDWLPVAADGKLGRQTIHAAKFYAWVLGLSGKHHATIKSGTITEAAQRLLRNPTKRSRIDRLRESRRKGKLAKIRKAQSEGPKAAVAYARSFVGTTENPPSSNTGPTIIRDGHTGGVSFWERYWGLGACYWCLCFACYCVRAIGGARIDGLEADSNPVNAEVIERMAKEHAHGWIVVSTAECREGDIVLCCFDGSGVPDHGELAVGPITGGVTNDVGGNTSSGSSGSQSNGGGVFATDRSLDLVTCIARPLYS